jgi:hypothetical protein
MTKRLNIQKWDKYNRLTIIKEVDMHIKPNWKRARKFMVECECWAIKNIMLWHIISWWTKSCWCLKLEPTYLIHNMTGTKIYKSWDSMKRRCNKNKDWNYKNYWWRWIAYDKKWEKFEWFYEDMWSTYKEWLSIDRIDNNWHYNKKNCKWSTSTQQARNRRSNIMYKWKCIAEWFEELWLSRSTYYRRINKWWTIEKALFGDLV